jgi:ferric-dicitrate binding protein FerR (iron transport regulator)
MGPGGMMRMEPQPVNAGDDWLDQVLRADAAEHAGAYLADEGFTARVLERLPRPATLPAWRRPVVALLWAIVGIAVVVALPIWFEDVFRGAAALFFGHRFTLSDLVGMLALFGAATWSALFFAARAE